jgi:hypothetical protein
MCLREGDGKGLLSSRTHAELIRTLTDGSGSPERAKDCPIGGAPADTTSHTLFTGEWSAVWVGGDPRRPLPAPQNGRAMPFGQGIVSGEWAIM